MFHHICPVWEKHKNHNNTGAVVVDLGTGSQSQMISVGILHVPGRPPQAPFLSGNHLIGSLVEEFFIIKDRKGEQV